MKGRAGHPVLILAVDTSFLILNCRVNLPAWFPEKLTITLNRNENVLHKQKGLEGEADGFELDIQFEIMWTWVEAAVWNWAADKGQ